MPTNGRAATTTIQAMREAGSRLGRSRMRPMTTSTSSVWARNAIREWWRKTSILAQLPRVRPSLGADELRLALLDECRHRLLVVGGARGTHQALGLAMERGGIVDVQGVV